jgi:hypothetical protein
MKESNEQTMEEAEARLRQPDGDVSVFKVSRATISGGRAVGGLMTVHAPSGLTYHELDALLQLIPAEPAGLRTVELPLGTQPGFLTAMESLVRQTVGPCTAGDSVRELRAIPYVYNQTLYDLSLSSCKREPELRTSTGTFADVVDGRFRLRNRRTNNETTFRLFYGASGGLRALPIRALFRPRWWLEVELVLDPSAAGANHPLVTPTGGQS